MRQNKFRAGVYEEQATTRANAEILRFALNDDVKHATARAKAKTNAEILRCALNDDVCGGIGEEQTTTKANAEILRCALNDDVCGGIGENKQQQKPMRRFFAAL